MGEKKSREMGKKTGEVRGVTGNPGKKDLRPSYKGPEQSGSTAFILGTMLRMLEPKNGTWPSPSPEMNLPEVFLWPQTNSSLLPNLHSVYPFVKRGRGEREDASLSRLLPWLSRQRD